MESPKKRMKNNSNVMEWSGQLLDALKSDSNLSVVFEAIIPYNWKVQQMDRILQKASVTSLLNNWDTLTTALWRKAGKPRHLLSLMLYMHSRMQDSVMLQKKIEATENYFKTSCRWVERWEKNISCLNPLKKQIKFLREGDPTGSFGPQQGILYEELEEPDLNLEQSVDTLYHQLNNLYHNAIKAQNFQFE